MKNYTYSVAGTAAGGEPWTVDGSLTVASLGAPGIFDKIMGYVFERLTRGEAVYGHPGVGCRGPYAITKIVIEQVPSS